MRMVVRKLEPTHPYLRYLLPLMKTNVGFIFNMGDATRICDIIDKCRVTSVARVGAIAPCDVMVRKQMTSIVPTETSFFQAVNVPTKITKGAIEIIADVPLIFKGNKVTQSQAAVLSKLNMKPFEYGLVPVAVYDTESLEIVVPVLPRSSMQEAAVVVEETHEVVAVKKRCDCDSAEEEDYFDLFGEPQEEPAKQVAVVKAKEASSDSDNEVFFDIFD